MTLDKLLARLNDPYRHQWTSAMIAATCDAAFAVIGEQAHKIDALAAEQGRPVLDDTTGELAAQHYLQHEFYRVEKMVEAEQDRVEELERQLAAAQSRLDAAKEAIDFLHWMESAAPKTLETLESWREQFEYATNSKLSADKRGDSGS